LHELAHMKTFILREKGWRRLTSCGYIEGIHDIDLRFAEETN
jgi:hypothetical protein